MHVHEKSYHSKACEGLRCSFCHLEKEEFPFDLRQDKEGVDAFVRCRSVLATLSSSEALTVGENHVGLSLTQNSDDGCRHPSTDHVKRVSIDRLKGAGDSCTHSCTHYNASRISGIPFSGFFGCSRIRSLAVLPSLFFTVGSAPTVRSAFTAAGRPYPGVRVWHRVILVSGYRAIVDDKETNPRSEVVANKRLSRG